MNRKTKPLLTAICCAAALTLFSGSIPAQNAKPAKAELYVQTGHADSVEAVAFSPDGRVIASGGDGTVKLWSAETGQELRTLGGAESVGASVAFSRDGRLIASGGTTGGITIWDAEIGRETQTLSGHASIVQSIAFSPDGKTLVSGSADKTARLWNVETGEETRMLGGQEDFVKSVAFSPDGRVIATASNNVKGAGAVTLWSANDGRELRTLRAANPKTINSIAFSTDGRIIAVGSIAGDGVNEIILWNAADGREIRKFGGEAANLLAIALSPDGRTLASANADKTVLLWNAQTGEHLETLEGHTEFVNSVAFAPDGKTLISGGSDGKIKKWNAATGAEIETLDGRAARIGIIAFAPDGRALAAEGADNTIRLWRAEAGKELQSLRGHTGSVSSFAFSPDGQTIVSSSYDQTLRLWSADTAQEIRTLKGHSGYVLKAEFSPDGRAILSSDADGSKKLWNAADGRELLSIKTQVGQGNQANTAFSPDGKIFAAEHTDSTIKLWSAATGKELRALGGYTGEIENIRFSPDGRIVAAAGDKTRLNLWDAGTGKQLQTLGAADGAVGSLEFSADGRNILTGNSDGKGRLWQVATGKEILVFGDYDHPVYAAAFSFDEQSIVAKGTVDKFTVWNAATGELRETFSADDTTAENRAALERRLAAFKISREFYPLAQPVSSDRRFRAKQNGGKIDVHDVKTDRLLVSLVALDENEWAVVAPDGYFDGTPDAWTRLSWRLGEELFKVAPVEAFFNEFFRPNLLADIFAGNAIEKPARDIAAIDIRQPVVKLSQTETQTNPRQAKINVSITDAPADERQPNATSGANDVRLFRNGSLVKVWRGDVLQGKSAVTLTAEVPIIAGENVLTAYAFNRANVKSRDARLNITGADALKRAATLFVLAVGVNEYQNKTYNLRFAVPDVDKIAAELAAEQAKLTQKQFAKVEFVRLADADATKAKILDALNNLAKQIQPEDAVLIYFAGHGKARCTRDARTGARNCDRFYLVPTDGIPVSEKQPNPAAWFERLYAQSVSDEELETVLEKIDAGKMLMVIDACDSGQALEAEEKRRAPMNSRGLAQLAYEKGMYILAASQSRQAALETSKLGHGLLTFSLLQGLKAADADKNQIVVEREWLDFAVRAVPNLQLEAMKTRDAETKTTPAKRQLVIVEDEAEAALPPEKRQLQTPRVFYRRETDARPLVVAKP